MAGWSRQEFLRWSSTRTVRGTGAPLLPEGPTLRHGRLTAHDVPHLLAAAAPREYNLISEQLDAVMMVSKCSLCGKRIGKRPNGQVSERNQQFLRHWWESGKCRAE